MATKKIESLAKVRLENGLVGFVLSSLTTNGVTKYHLGQKPDNNCYHEIMGWYPESMITNMIKVYRRGRYIDVGFNETN